VVRKGDDSGTQFVAKVYKYAEFDDLFELEVDAMKQIGGQEGFSNLVDAFGDKEHGNVFVMNFVAG